MSGDRDLRVAFFGDSFVVGIGDPEGRGWVGRIVASAFAAGLPLTAYNLGVRRETSADVLRRWRDEALVRLPAGSERRVVFSFGANDATVENGMPRVAPEASVANLRRAVADARALDAAVLIVGPPPAEDDAQLGRITALSASYAAAAAELGTPYVDVAATLRDAGVWMDEARAGDGAHPGAAGYELLAALVREPFLHWLGAAGASRLG